MRRQLKNHLDEGGEGMVPLAKDAVAGLDTPPAHIS